MRSTNGSSPRSIISANDTADVSEKVLSLSRPRRGVVDQLASSKRELTSPADTAIISQRKNTIRRPRELAQLSFGCGANSPTEFKWREKEHTYRTNVIREETYSIQVPLKGARLSPVDIDIDQSGTTRKIPDISAIRLMRDVNLPSSHSASSLRVLSLLICSFGSRAKLSAAILCNILDADRPTILARARDEKKMIVEVMTTTESLLSVGLERQ